MDINHIAVWACTILSMVLGAVWYGPVFGKKWIEIIGATDMDLERTQEMEMSARPLYFISFVLTLFQVYILAYFISLIPILPAVCVALWAWAAFVIPTVAAGAMWNNDSRKISWARFLIQAGYYLVLFLLFGIILGM